MKGERITNRLVNRLKATGEEYWVWDDLTRGFGVRVMPSGSMAFVVKYRAGSGRGAQVRRVTLDKVGTITPDDAREIAKRVLGDVARGEDPAARRATERRAATLNELAELFLSEVEAKRKPATADHYRHLLERRVLPELGTRKADKVTHSGHRAPPHQAQEQALRGQSDGRRHRKPLQLRQPAAPPPPGVHQPHQGHREVPREESRAVSD
jgi:hypothetical protein